MTKYTDRNGVAVKEGDIIKYDEYNTSKWGKAIYEIVQHKGELAGVCRISYPYWTYDESNHPLRLAAFCIKPDTVMVDSEVIGNIRTNPEMLTVEYADYLFPGLKGDKYTLID